MPQNRRSVEEASEELARRGMPFSEESFLRYVRSGREDAVELYLDAGISPDAAIDGKSALAVAAGHGHREVMRLLLAAGADASKLADGLDFGKSSRSGWDRLSSLSGIFTFISSLVIAAVGWYFTNSYNERQLELADTSARLEQANKEYQNRLAEMQTVERFIPHLIKDESSKQVALIAISTLASPDIAAQIAQAYGGQGSINALTQMARTENERSAAPAISALTSIASRELASSEQPGRQALAGVLQDREQAIVTLFVAGRVICNGFLLEGTSLVVTAGFCLSSAGSARDQLAVEFVGGNRVDVKDSRIEGKGLLAFLELESPPTTGLRLSKKKLGVGSTISQLAFRFDRASPQLGVALGTVVEAGEMGFATHAGGETRAEGLKVTFTIAQDAQGTAGGPLLDNEGNVACMTFMGTRDWEQCISSAVIAMALESVPRT